MIRFKQKQFFWGNAILLGTTGLSMGQASSQSKEQEAQSEETQRLIQQQNEKLDRIAAVARKSPAAAGAAAEAMAEGKGKLYSRTFSVMKDLAGAWRKSGFQKGLKNSLGFAVAGGIAGYGVNKLIQRDMKKNNLDVDESGNLVQKSYTEEQQATKSIFARAKGAAGKYLLSTPVMAAGFEGLSYMNYAADKKQLRNQLAATQKNFANPYSILSNPVKWFKNTKFWQHKAQTLSGFGVQLGSFGMGGTQNIQKFGRKLGKSDNGTLKSIGNWIQEHPVGANVAALVPATAVGYGGFTLADKAVRGGMKRIDPEAYKYPDAKEKQVN